MQLPVEGIGAPELELQASCESPDMGQRNQTEVLHKSSKCS